jgi:hypothetical protein
VTTPAEDAVAHVVVGMTAGWPSVTWAAGTNVFRGPPQPAKGPVPVLSLWVVSASSPEAVYLKDGGLLESRRIKVFARHLATKYGELETLGEVIHRCLDRNPPSGYYECKSLSSCMQMLGADDQGHLMSVCDFLLQRRTTA